MSGLRRLCREVAANQSYRRNGTTDFFDRIFERMWRGTAAASERHPEYKSSWSPTKKRRRK